MHQKVKKNLTQLNKVKMNCLIKKPNKATVMIIIKIKNVKQTIKITSTKTRRRKRRRRKIKTLFFMFFFSHSCTVLYIFFVASF